MITLMQKEKIVPGGFGDYIRDLAHTIEWKLENFGLENATIIHYYTPTYVTSYTKDNFENRLLSVPAALRTDIGITWKFYNTESRQWYQPTRGNHKQMCRPTEKEKAALQELLKVSKDPKYAPVNITHFYDVQVFDLKKIAYGEPIQYSFIFDHRKHDGSITFAEWPSNQYVKSNEEFEREVWAAFLKLDKVNINFIDFFKLQMIVPILDRVKSEFKIDLKDFKLRFLASKIFDKKNSFEYYPLQPEPFQFTLYRALKSQVIMGPEGGWYHFAVSANIPYVMILPSWLKDQGKDFVDLLVDGLWCYTVPTNPMSFIFEDALIDDTDLVLEKIKKWSISATGTKNPYPMFFIDPADKDAVKVKELFHHFWARQISKVVSNNEKYYL